MILSVYVFLAVCVALWIGLRFLRIRGIGVAIQALITGIASALSYFWLQSAGHSAYFVWCQMAILALSVLSLLLWRRCKWGAIAHVFLISQSAVCVFEIPFSVIDALGWFAYGVGVATIVVFAMMTIQQQNRFLEEDWQEAFQSDNEERSIPRIQQMYLIPGGMCALLTAASMLLRIINPIGCGLLCLLGTTVYWLGVCQVLVINEYEKDRTSLLAEQQYRGEMQSFLNVIRSQRHDYNFHVQTIAGLIRQNKMEECLRYINALEEDVAIMNAVLPIRDPAISALIHNFRLMAVRQSTELHVDIHYDLSQIATNVYETNRIISNLLQNAIDEVSTHEDKSHGIWLTILKRGEYCVIRVANQLKEPLNKEDLDNIYRQGYTTKQGHEGVGLSSLRTLLGRYKGVIYTQVEGNEIQFIARVPINYAKEPVEE